MHLSKYLTFISLTFIPSTICTNLPGSIAIPNLNYLLSPFSNCLVHLINYQSIDFEPFIIPVVLERFWRIKYKKNKKPTSHSFYMWWTHDKTNPNVTLKLMSNQNANFHWQCNYHGFLLPNQRTLEKSYIPDWYSQYWNEVGNMLVRISSSTESPTSYDKRSSDYYALFTENDKPKNWMKFALGVDTSHRTFHTSSHNLIIQILKDSISNPQLHLICHHCQPDKYIFIQLNGLYEKDNIDAQFIKIRSTRNPKFPYLISDPKYQGPTGDTVFKTNQPNLINVSESASLDILLFSIVNPNCTYLKVFHMNWFQKTKQPSPPPTWIQIDTPNAYYFAISDSSYKFLTCDGSRADVTPSFYGFVSAYKPSTWMITLIATLCTIVALKLIFSMNNIRQNPFLIPITLFLEQGINIKSNSSRMAGFSGLIGTWMLMCVILSNAYKGQNITDLTSPLKPGRMEYFDELIQKNFTFYNPVWMAFSMVDQAYYEHPHGLTYFDGPVRAFARQVTQSQSFTTESTLTELRKVKDIQNRTVALKKCHNITLLESILDCNRTAIIGTLEEIDVYENILKIMKPKGIIAKGKESILPQKNGWYINNLQDDHLHLHLQALIQSGLVDMWKIYLQFLKSIRNPDLEITNSKNDEWKPLTLDGNLKVVFYLFLGSVIISVFMLFGENLKNAVKTCISNRKNLVHYL